MIAQNTIDVDRLTVRLERNPPASACDIDEFTARLGIVFPPGYVDFMRQSDGAEGPIGKKNRYLVLWSLGDIATLNRQYKVSEFAPHLILFGSDGGGEAFAFDCRTKPAAIVRVAFVGLDEAVYYGDRFDQFLFGLSEE